MTNQNQELKKGKWQPYQGDEDSWSEMLKDFPNKGYLNDISWEKHLSNMGWVCLRWEFSRLGSPMAYCQSFFKSYPFGVGILWIPDGIVGHYRYISSLQQDLFNSLELRYCYIRFRDSKVFNPDDYIKLLIGGWVRAKTPLSAGMTMSLDISQPIEVIKAGLTKNWRKTLKKSSNMPFDIVTVCDPIAIAGLYLEMKSSKSLRCREIYTDVTIESIMKSYHDNILVLGARDPEGTLVAIRGAILAKEKATDIFAATSQKGRELMSSHALLLAVIEGCKNNGCTLYDLNGIDPSNNMGVYNFKKGTGASPMVAMGEFECSNNRLLSFFVNLKSKY